MKDTIRNQEELMQLLDDLFRNEEERWQEFYKDRDRDIPFFVDAPDENLAAYFEMGIIQPGRVLELGCGAGRNAIYMAQQGCTVDALDLSERAITWGRERAAEKEITVNFQAGNVFTTSFPDIPYDVIYDSGLFHHLWPHRRIQYVDLLASKLRPSGHLGLVCFAPGFEEEGGAAERSDKDVYRVVGSGSGLSYSKERLTYLLSGYFEPVEVRLMNEHAQNEPVFGKRFLWASLWRRK
ncbi:SAM-dependent methyltransferase [Paenibacillus sambharensis]|uniref:SAM-dependent methyltransferase n=1 Tax=Paenibacillus sambharensis TaxID=1803190 RepID=A0A2W1M063_9BACL|nr:class I SAM-dependent methyltransferase [Paenibacillus sambharensis]PZD97331.1 SAM-dependent methyltransferase [Paenibacillus sambharensis]